MTFKRWTAAFAVYSIAAAAASKKTTIAVNPVAQDSHYVAKVTVGNSTVNLDVKTSSGEFWVFSSLTPPKQREGHRYYTPGSSATEWRNSTWGYSVDNSLTQGIVFSDTVAVGNISYNDQAVQAATYVDFGFPDDHTTDGVLGLGFHQQNKISPVPQQTYFENIQASLERPLFTACLKHNQSSSFDFGFIDPSKYTGKIIYTDVDSSKGFWAFTADDYSINGSKGGKPITGIADTDSAINLLDDDIVDAYYKQVDGAYFNGTNGGYIFPCQSDLPTFALNIHGYDATIPGEQINLYPINSTFCYGGIQSNTAITANADPGVSTFGNVLLKTQFVVFDGKGPQIGFAAQA